ncbi:hypothetical protein Afil01_10460 [Actinorhabdospora filicis]|uniref:Uncharacterized protein n=1 Tax=Actinorhabdospora filicis TaxID=1785913 RepID=A0A9W6SIP9_9ACTN|nr:hypothetical protein Afil01_10460 [Actinorhabdospora filicis]
MTAQATSTGPARAPGGVAVSVLAVAAAVWVGIQIIGLRTLLSDVVADDSQGVVQLVLYLSGIIVGSTFAGVVAGTIVLWWTAGRPDSWAARQPRAVAGAFGGLVVGLIAGGLTFAVFSDKTGVASLVGGVIGATAIVGGLVAALRPPAMVTAGLLGGIVLLVIWFVRGLNTVRDTGVDLLDGDGSALSRMNAYSWYSLSTSLLAGVLIGGVVHVYLRRTGAKIPLLGHLFAGALPGLICFYAEIIMWIVGKPLLAGAGEISVIDETGIQLQSGTQFNAAMATLFAGAMTALLAVGLLTPKTAPVPAQRGKTGAKGGATTGAKARPAQKGRTTPGRGRPENRP